VWQDVTLADFEIKESGILLLGDARNSLTAAFELTDECTHHVQGRQAR